MDIEEDHDDSYSHQDSSPNGERMGGEIAGEVLSLLTRVELDSAYISEKLLNLEILLMQVENRENDCEGLILQNEDTSVESLQKALEFDALSGILSSEVKELDSFMTSLQVEFVEAYHQLTMDDHCEQSVSEIGEKLHDAEDHLKQSENQLADMRMRSAKFERSVTFGNGGDKEAENGDFASLNADWKLQTVEHQRHILQLYEKSLARELDLEKKLSDSRCFEDDLKGLKIKLQCAERETYFLEESMEISVKKMFEAENAAELLLGISQELLGKLQIVQFNLNGSIRREADMRSKLQETMLKLSAKESALEKLKHSSAALDNVISLQENGLKANIKEVEDQNILASSEVLNWRENVICLEKELKEAGMQLQQAKASAEASEQQQNMLQSELREMEHAIEALKGDARKAETRAKNAEAKCTLLTDTNTELNEELGVLKNNGAEKASLLKKKLQESDTQLEHAKASVEAIEEQQTILHSTLADMESLIEDLKSKVSKAEIRAENAESKCTLLTETNLELNEELGFLRSRLDCLETSLHQEKNAKIATANDIGIKTKIIGDLVMKLALERERLHLKISALSKTNKILEKKCLTSKDEVPVTAVNKGTDDGNQNSVLKSSGETLTEPSTANSQVEKAAPMSTFETGEETSVCAEDTFDSAPKQTVRTIDATQLYSKWFLIAFLVILMSFLVSISFK